MGELYNPFPKLPKNIRQIGERDQSVKLYVEDYVNTYLSRLYPTGGQDLRVGLLLGSIELSDGMPYIFIDGAMEMEEVTEEGQKVVFSEAAWKKASKNMDQLFPKREIQGWFLCGSPGNELSPLNYWKQHVQYFQGPNKVMYLSNGMEGDETVYITSEDGFYKLQGYCIYYERNEMMQDYMVLRKDVKRVEAGADDQVIRQYKKRLEEHKGEVVERRQTYGLLKGMCAAMSVILLAGGIVMFGNYQKMRDMESVIASALPEKAGAALMGEQEDKNQEAGIVIEEADGGVYPTRADVRKESMPQTMPEDDNTNQSGFGDDRTDGTGQGGAANQGAAEGQYSAGEQGTNGGQEAASPGSGMQGSGAQDNGAQSGGQNQGGSGPTSAANQGKASAQTGGKADAAALEAAGVSVHIVAEGETLYSICLARYHSVNRLEEICELNGLEDVNRIVAGQKLLLPE